jgi:hypothetical protein
MKKAASINMLCCWQLTLKLAYVSKYEAGFTIEDYSILWQGAIV